MGGAAADSAEEVGKGLGLAAVAVAAAEAAAGWGWAAGVDWAVAG